VLASDHFFPWAAFFTIYDIAITFAFSTFACTFFVFKSCWWFIILLWFSCFWFSYFWFSCFWFSCFWFGCFWFIDSFSNVLFLLLIFLFLRFSLFRLFSSFYLFFCRIYFLALTYTLLCNTRKGIFTKYSILTCCSAFDIFLYEVFASDHLFPGATFFTIYDIASTFAFSTFICTFFVFKSCRWFIILLWFNSFWFSYFWFSCFWLIDSFGNLLLWLFIFIFLLFYLFRLFCCLNFFFCGIDFLALAYTLLWNTRKGIFTKTIITGRSSFNIFFYEVFACNHLFPGAALFTIYDIASTFTFASFISTFFIFWSCWLFFILLWFSCFWFFCCFVVICWLSLTILLCCYSCTFGDLFFNSIKLISIRIHFFCHFIKFIFVNFFCFYYFFRFFFNGFVFQFCNFVFDFFRFSFTGYFLLFFNSFLFYILDFFDNSFFIEHLDSFLTVSFYNGLFFILFSLFYLLFFFSNLCDNFVSLCDSIICLLFDLVNILLNFLLNLLKFLLSLCLFNWCLCFFDCFFLLLNFFFGLFKLFDGNFGNFFFGIFSSFLDLFSLFLFFLVLFYLFIHQFLDFGLSLFWIFFTRNFIIVRFFSIPSLIIWYANWFCNFVIFVLFNNFVQDVLSFDLLIKFFYHLFDCSLFIFSISFFWFFWFLKWFTNILWIGVLTNHSDAFLNSLFSCLSWVRSWWLFW